MMEYGQTKFSRHVLGASRKQKLHGGSKPIYECRRCGHRYRPVFTRDSCPECGYGLVNRVHSMVNQIKPIEVLQKCLAQ